MLGPIDPSLIKKDANTLVLEFPNLLMTARELAVQYPYTVPATRFYNVWSEPTHRSFVRKAGSDFGWDWGPALVPIGIYYTISSQQCPMGRLDGLLVHQRDLIITNANSGRETTSTAAAAAKVGTGTEAIEAGQDTTSTKKEQERTPSTTTTSSVVLDVSIRLSGIQRRVETYASVYLNDEFQFNTKFIVAEDRRTVRYQRSSNTATRSTGSSSSSSASSTGAKSVPLQRTDDTTMTDTNGEAQCSSAASPASSTSSGDRDDHCTATPAVVTIALGSITVNDVKLWWPRGYGQQDMYDIEVRYFNPVLSSANSRFTGSDSDSDSSSSSSSSHAGSPPRSDSNGRTDSGFHVDGHVEPLFQVMKRRIGVRHIVLVQDDVIAADDKTTDGPTPTAFHFLINHVAVVARGANMIPLDVFQSKVTKADRQYMLAAAVEANMNMVRVWGGGKYGEDRKSNRTKS